MALLEWRDEYRTGIDGVDYEHEALIGRINAVYALMQDTSDPAEVIDGLGEIYGNIAAHFALEEQMMLRHDYPEYPAHRADHERLLDEIRDITAAYQNSAERDGAGFEQRLRDWFGTHFKTHDARLHALPGMREHEPVNRLALRDLIDDAKKKLLRHRN